MTVQQKDQLQQSEEKYENGVVASMLQHGREQRHDSATPQTSSATLTHHDHQGQNHKKTLELGAHSKEREG